MKDIFFNGDNIQFQSKNDRVSFSFFLLIILLISILVIGYISSNIVLMKLGYQSMDLEQEREQLLAENNQLEYTVENLSSLTRIEQIAYQDLAMHRPEKIEFIAMLPANSKVNQLVNNPTEQGQASGYIEASIFPKQLPDLQIFKNR